MKWAKAVLLTTIWASAGILAAPAQVQTAKHGSEHERLSYFVGNWTWEGEMKPSPMGPGGKFLRTVHNDWLSGDFFLISHYDEKTPMGEGQGLAVLGFDPESRVYIHHDFNRRGETEASKGTVQGDTWTWLSQERMAGKMMKGRFTIRELSPMSFTFKFEMAPEEGEWSTVAEGKATKVK